MSGAPDPKPLEGRKRERDPFAVRIAAAADPVCVACGDRGANGHHVLERDDGGDDVAENIVTLCGSGTMGCHGALHGNPYVRRRIVLWASLGAPTISTEYRDRDWVAGEIGMHLLLRRLDVIEYVVGRLGAREAARYLEGRYQIDPRELSIRGLIPEEMFPIRFSS